MTTQEDRRTLRVGTRTSRLARIQTHLFIQAALAKRPDLEFEIVGIETAAERRPNTPIPDLGQGVFVKEIQIALANSEIDFAVHSLKDLPTRLPPGHTLAAVMPRNDPRDVLVSRDGQGLNELPPGARVGTGSVRRAAQVLARRPDLEIVLLRGNVDTRVRKVTGEGREIEAEAAVLAAVGLQRLGMERVITEYLEPDVMLPAVGQGSIGIECLESNTEACVVAALTEEREQRIVAEAERAFLAAVGGFCRTPLASYATVDGDVLSIEALAATPDGTIVLRESLTTGLTTSSAEIGERLLNALFARGAGDFIILDDEPADDD